MAEQVSIKDFLRKRQMAKKEIKFKGFEAPFVIEEISNEENEQLQKQATKTTKSRSGQVMQNIDQDKYAQNLILKSVVQPDLNSEELQEFYGTLADPYGTLKRMLSIGELAALVQAVNNLSTVDQTLDDKVDEAKN
ncbi:phage tail assembly chaperone [Levilactobacillus andaensis]|uniref:phage tail assembly chaperone n=1 Tax=Levilactobacillus andaensis TaxID=2799570 RepID=UPI001944601A|nr:phage portal protein [Levilactobacillus andaensis]